MALENEVIARAPASAIAWNRRATAVNDEPDDLVDETIARIGLDLSRPNAQPSSGSVTGTRKTSLPSGVLSREERQSRLMI
jgi:hypothetical protein